MTQPRRGDLITVVTPGAYGKPHPALVIQSDHFDEHPSVTVLPITSHLRATPLFRIDIASTGSNGLRQPSQVMIDKAVTVPRERLGDVIGRIDASTQLAVDRGLAVFLGIAP